MFFFSFSICDVMDHYTPQRGGAPQPGQNAPLNPDESAPQTSQNTQLTLQEIKQLSCG